MLIDLWTSLDALNPPQVRTRYRVDLGHQRRSGREDWGAAASKRSRWQALAVGFPSHPGLHHYIRAVLFRTKMERNSSARDMEHCESQENRESPISLAPN